MLLRLWGIAALGLLLIGIAWRATAPERAAGNSSPDPRLGTTAQAQTAPSPQVAARSYPETFRRDFMTQCVGDRPELQVICDCTYRRITASYTYQQYLILTHRLQTEGRIPLEIAQINQACVSAASP